MLATQHIDPLFARAHAGLSLSHFNDLSCQASLQLDEKASRLSRGRS